MTTGRDWPPDNTFANRKRKRWLWVLGCAVFLILIISLSTCSAKPATSVNTGGVNNLPTSHVFVPPVVSSAVAGATLGQQAPPPQPAGIGDGTYEVGADMPAGKYKTTGPSPLDYYPNCYFARLKHNDGSAGDIIDNNNSKGPVVVTVKVGEYFETTGCASWVKQ
jgi:hypothetical protein